jgi:hypothetical protein
MGSCESGPLIEEGWAVLLVPYAVLVLSPTAGRGDAADLRVVRRADGVAGISCSEIAGEVPRLLAALLAARVLRLGADMVGFTCPDAVNINGSLIRENREF